MKSFVVISILGILLLLVGNLENARVEAINCCSDDECPTKPQWSVTCQGVHSTCPLPHYGTCYYTTLDPHSYCIGWDDWSDCYLDGGSCVSTRFCANPSWYTAYQIRRCGAGACDEPCNPGGTSCGACSTSCGPGTKTCSDGCDDWTVACNNGPCCDPDSWGVCSVSCGGGTQTNDCGTPRSCNPQACGPWWQVKDADVQTNGDLDSTVPGGLYFGLPGLGEFPGVAKYGGSTSLTSLNVSSKGWLANSLYSPSNNKIQNYTYFRRLIPEDVILNPISSSSIDGSFFESGGTLSDGYYWYEYDGSVTGLPLSITSSITLPDERKVVILVTGTDLNIGGSITYTSGKSILVILVNGNINIDPLVGGAVYDLQGFFLADGDISTGVSSETLHVKGSMVAQGSLVLERDLGDPLNGTTASEVFEYDPASIFLFPLKLSLEKTRWKEVAP